MTLTFSLMQAFISSFLIGLGVGICFKSVMRLFNSIFGNTD